MKMRGATNKDTEAVKDVVFSILREYGMEPDPTDTDRDLDDLEKTYIHPGGTFEVLLDGDHIVGTFGLFRLNDSTCELRKMYLKKEMRGRGLGKLILDRVLQRAKELGFKTLELETASVLKEAINLYTRYGFQLFKKDHMVARCNQAFRIHLG